MATLQVRYRSFRETIGQFGEFISRPRVGIVTSGTIGQFGEFISRPRAGIVASGAIGQFGEFTCVL